MGKIMSNCLWFAIIVSPLAMAAERDGIPLTVDPATIPGQPVKTINENMQIQGIEVGGTVHRTKITRSNQSSSLGRGSVDSQTIGTIDGK